MREQGLLRLLALIDTGAEFYLISEGYSCLTSFNQPTTHYSCELRMGGLLLEEVTKFSWFWKC